MASTTFTDGSTVIRASWLNDVNTAEFPEIPVYTPPTDPGVQN